MSAFAFDELYPYKLEPETFHDPRYYHPTPHNREQQLGLLVEIAGLTGEHWGGSNDTASPLVSDIIARVESSGLEPSTKDGIHIGLIAVASQVQYGTFQHVKSWGLSAHIGMLNALGASLATGMHADDRTLDIATEVHMRKTGVPDTTSLATAYATPDSTPVLNNMRKTANNHYVVITRTIRDHGFERFLDQWAASLDATVRGLPPGATNFNAAAKIPEAASTIERYAYILGQIAVIRQSLAGHSDEIHSTALRAYGRYKLNCRKQSSHVHD